MVYVKKMEVKIMDYVNKVVSKIYSGVNHKNEAIAEVIENPGCGFDYLVRIDERYKTDLPIFSKCMELCKINQIIDYNYINESIKRECLYKHENIALIIDKVI